MFLVRRGSVEFSDLHLGKLLKPVVFAVYCYRKHFAEACMSVLFVKVHDSFALLHLG